MIRTLCVTTALALAGTVHADPLTVSETDKPAEFLQLESSGRKNIAADDTQVGLVWEETRGGQTTSYVAFKPLAGGQPFGQPVALGQNTFNPVIARCGTHFFVGWIADDSVKASTFDAGKPGEAAQITTGPINELTIGCKDDNALLAWSRRAGRGYAVEAASVQPGPKGTLTHSQTVAVAPTDKYQFQTNPGVAYAEGRVVVTWHDRTSGTNLLYASSGPALDKLDKQVQINELIKKSYEWGSGSSAVRNALAVGKNQRLVAVWLDKRASRAGYKVYSAFSNDGGQTWGDNYDIIDEWGAIVPQWTPAVASDDQDHLRVVWMDAREEIDMLWTSRLSGMTWGANATLLDDIEGAHSPVVAYSPNGTFHVAWIETSNGKSRLRYFSEKD